MFISGFSGRGQLSKAIIDNDIIRVCSYISNPIDREYALKHLNLTHAKIKKLAQSCPPEKCKETKEALSKLGYIYRYIFDVALRGDFMGRVMPYNKNYGALACISHAAMYRDKDCSIYSGKDTRIGHAIILRAKAELKLMLETYQQPELLDMIVLNDQRIRDILGDTTSLTIFFTRYYEKYPAHCYYWLTRRKYAISVVNQYIKLQHLLYDEIPCLFRFWPSKRRENNAIYIQLDYSSQPRDLSTILEVTETSLNVRRPQCCKEQNRQELISPLGALYKFMPSSFKDLNLNHRSLTIATGALYYLQSNPIIYKFLKHQHVDINEINKLASGLTPISHEDVWDTNTMMTSPIYHKRADSPKGSVRDISLKIDKHMVMIGGLVVPRDESSIMHIRLKDTIYRCPGIITLDFENNKCIHPLLLSK